MNCWVFVSLKMPCAHCTFQLRHQQHQQHQQAFSISIPCTSSENEKAYKLSEHKPMQNNRLKQFEGRLCQCKRNRIESEHTKIWVKRWKRIQVHGRGKKKEKKKKKSIGVNIVGTVVTACSYSYSRDAEFETCRERERQRQREDETRAESNHIWIGLFFPFQFSTHYNFVLSFDKTFQMQSTLHVQNANARWSHCSFSLSSYRFVITLNK